MELLIFQTDIKSKNKVKSVEPILNSHSNILKWTIDLEDIDNVLRIEATKNLMEEEVIDLLKVQGFSIQTLPD
ncbi:MAG: hypothetical protein HUJ11_05610 [Arenibacter algicola]|jgi:hypothetical protein|nr:hypothetical protein [Arenibacter algicola]MDX1759505.1 hypothetical protein [Arenibacter algicola]|tara:strand:+ start:958 stop:1176 length:219 start_codon:yes stop_codon:yes gene_type:complete